MDGAPPRQAPQPAAAPAGEPGAAEAAELVARLLQRAGLPDLASLAAAAPPREPLAAPRPATEDPAAEAWALSQELLRLGGALGGGVQHGATPAAASAPLAPGRATSSRGSLGTPAFGFLWPLLPPFLERPTRAASLAAVARGTCRALQDTGRLRVGHLMLHPNSLGSPEARAAARAGQDEYFAGCGCLARASLGSLVTVQFHLPQLSEAFWLLEGLARGRCHSLRKIVDRQSRWRPREVRFEGLDEAARARAAELADELGRSLKSLRHLEGPVFSLLLRARGRAHAAAASAAEGFAEAGGEGAAAATAAPGAAGSRCLGSQVETLHLMDALAVDLLGLHSPACPRLKKLVLLNLPSAAPGQTATAVAEFLPKVPNLTELQLDFQFFDPASWDLAALEALVERVQTPPSKVGKLLLEWCRLGDAGVRCVCQALARNARCSEGGGVSELSLAHCELRDVESVCEMLEAAGTAITKLDLSSNSLDDFQAGRLAKALPLSKLKELRLRDSQISVPLPVKTEWFWGC